MAVLRTALTFLLIGRGHDLVLLAALNLLTLAGRSGVQGFCAWARALLFLSLWSRGSSDDAYATRAG